MTQDRRKMRKHELKRQAYLAGLTTMAVGAVALTSGFVHADEQTVATNPSSDGVNLITQQGTNQGQVQGQTDQVITGSQVDSENQQQVQGTTNQLIQDSANESQIGVEPEKVSAIPEENIQANSEVSAAQDVSAKPEMAQEVMEKSQEENSAVKKASVVTVVERKSINTVSAARGDDYPAYLKNAAPDSVIDPWRLYNRECTSFTAWRLSSVNGFTIPGAYGNGGQWGYRARREGYRVDNNPAIGSVGWLDDGSYGHVAWISNVIGDNVEIEEYNYGWNYNYHKRIAHKSAFTGYIHFKDLVVTSKPTDGRYDIATLVPSDRTISDGDYHIVLASNPEFGIDVSGAGSANGTNIQLYRNTTFDNQIFTVSFLGDGFYKLIHKATGKALDVNAGSTENGTNVQLWESNGTEAQQWVIKQSSGNNTYEIVSRRNGLVLDVANGTVANNSNLQVYIPNQSAAQKFKFVAVDKDAKRTVADGDYHIVSALDENMALDVENESKEDGANIQIYPNLTNSKEVFHVQYLNNGYYTITHTYSGKMIDDSGNGTFNGNNISIITPNGSESQQWMIKASTINGFFEIVSKHKDKVLDISGGVANPRTNVQLYSRNNTKAQAWKFIPVKKD
ncbi:RICIN domain-containing protein [Streptococcus tangpeifui]|uniref:RICIN domain-containing protein n=1 Tax=Streptococcus tangpeifui TaxID=2709400 RepID=UPI0013ECB1EB|nr:RICIN domain-containing protein [Streptococcus sp. ZJ373]